MEGFSIVPGTGALVLVAPHGGRRDAAARPWGRGRLRVNDLHTAELAAELAAATGAAALVNTRRDRNDVDLNRISEAHAHAPAFLAALAALLEAAIARHGRATLLTVHGWNVVQPALDLGVGCLPGADPFAVGPSAAVSPSFAATALAQLVEACAARGIAATVGARYPARARENLLQLFTTRYRDDARPLVRALAALAPRVDAVQLECAIPLRWPGAWRRRLVEACAAAAPALAAPPAAPRGEAPPGARPGGVPESYRLEFTAPELCGLAAIDGTGARLLLFPAAGGLALFTGERTGTEQAGCVGPLALTHRADGRHALSFDGPMLRFADTTPFLDLETGLAVAELVDARLGLDFAPDPALAAASTFGSLAGRVRVGGAEAAVAASAFCDTAVTEAPTPRGPRMRAALRLDARSALVLALGLDGGAVRGVLAREGRGLAVRAARATLVPAAAPLAEVRLAVELDGGEQLRIRARAVHRLPVIRARGAGAPVRLEFAACRLGTDTAPAGWCEVIGL